MPKRLIDYEAIWSSYKLSLCKPSSRYEFVWLYGLADAGGSFEMTNLRSVWGKVSPNRPDLTLRKLKSVLQDFHRNGILFTWTEKEKKFGHWVGSRKPGRLPPASQRSRFYFHCPEPPADLLVKYEAGPKSSLKLDPTLDREVEVDLDVDLEGNRNGNGLGFGAPSAHTTAARTAAASSNPSIGENSKAKPETLHIGSATVTIRKCQCGVVIDKHTIRESFGRTVCNRCSREVIL